MAVSVASGTPCVGVFSVPSAGRALVFMAEDNIADTRLRVASIAESRGVSLAELDLHLITSSTLLLDDSADREKLEATIKKLCPKVILLDPLVRLHRLDENSAREISGLLGFIRALQRSYNVAIIITHHATKRGNSRPGQALRGSSDIHAFGDSNLYISRRGADIDLAIEHRSAAAPDPVRLELVIEPQPHLALIRNNQTVESSKISLEKRVIDLLAAQNNQPLLRSTIRQQLKANNQRVGNALANLEAAGRIASSQSGYLLP